MQGKHWRVERIPICLPKARTCGANKILILTNQPTFPDRIPAPQHANRTKGIKKKMQTENPPSSATAPATRIKKAMRAAAAAAAVVVFMVAGAEL